jgi:hypothetical protein
MERTGGMEDYATMTVVVRNVGERALPGAVKTEISCAHCRFNIDEEESAVTLTAGTDSSQLGSTRNSCGARS